MGLVLYVLAGMVVVLALGWVLYVAPTPGPLAPTDLLVALLPSIAIVGGVCLLLGLLWLLAFGLRSLVRALRSLR